MAAHVPVRTCVGCRARAPKGELLRLAIVGGLVVADPNASRPGRGAYVHRRRGCVEAALAGGRLGRALRLGPASGLGPGQDGAATLMADIEGELDR